jgi:hypothetical protein
VIAAETEVVMHWTCPTCSLQWLDQGRGFPGQRFSVCIRCGADACEPADVRPAWHRGVPPAAWHHGVPPAAYDDAVGDGVPANAPFPRFRVSRGRFG